MYLHEQYDILYVIEQAKACAWYRCKVPGAALGQLGYRVHVTRGVTEDMLRASSLVIVQRPAHPHNITALKNAVAMGKRVAIELDDDLWHIDATNPAHRFWNRHTLGTLEECIRIVEFVTVTTPALASVVRPLNRNVRVLPNMLPGGAWPSGEHTDHSPLVVGWSGSPTHFRDLGLIRSVIGQVLDTHPQTVMHIAGTSHVPFAEHERIVSVPGSEIEHYPSVVGGFDIGLAPVIDSRFNRAKSDLKALEYAMCGIPVIASAGTYDSLPRDAGFLCKTPADWLRALSRLIERPDLRSRMGAAARTWAESRTIERNVGLWVDAYGLSGGGA